MESAPLDPPKKALLFLSYGRHDATPLAERLKRDLEANGYQVWWDVGGIPGGADWQQKVEDALRSAQVVVALLTPHAVRRVAGAGGAADSDSVCLDELSFARFGRPSKPIVPVMADKCEPPFCIFRLHFLDMCGWAGDEEQYRKGLQSLLSALEDAREGRVRYHDWIRTLEPLDFDEFLEEKRHGFCGREWLFAEIESWRKLSEQSVLLITGDPGIGKSAIVAQLVHLDPGGQIIGYHCCRTDKLESIAPAKFVRSLAAMIAGHLPQYAAVLSTNGSVRMALDEALCEKDPIGGFDTGILGPLRKLPAPQEGVRYILIDALDEALAADQSPTIVDLLASELNYLPPWLRVVATTRRDPDVLARLAGLHAEPLDAQDSRNLGDVEKYLATNLAEPCLCQRIRASGLTPNGVHRDILARSGGNFLYVHQVLAGIREGLYSLNGLAQLPPGLAGLYQGFFQRYFPDAPTYAPFRTLLETLVAAQEPLPRDLLALGSGFEPGHEFNALLSRLTPYLREEREADQPRYTIFHKSLSDWLTGVGLEHPHAYLLEARNGHERLSDICWVGLGKTCEGLKMPPRLPDALLPYAQRHAPRHFILAGHYARAVDRLDYLVRNRTGGGQGVAILPGDAVRLLCRHLPACPPQEAAKIDPHQLGALLPMVYEIQTLSSPVRLIVQHPTGQWPAVLERLLETDDFAIRYTFATTLADACEDTTDAVELRDVEGLLSKPDLGFRIVGGYALAQAYGSRPETINPELVRNLADGGTYIDRSIVGNLLRDLALRDIEDETCHYENLKPATLGTVFWSPIWEFNRIDVRDLQAFEWFMNGRPGDEKEDELGAHTAYEHLVWLTQVRRELISSDAFAKKGSTVRPLLEGYYGLGHRADEVPKCAAELGANPPDVWRRVLELFFGHPLWQAAEAGGTVIAAIAESKPEEALHVIRCLLRHDRWRVRYGAAEAAFEVRYLDDAESFAGAVDSLHSDPCPMVRGLCAENMTAWILSLAGRQRNAAIDRFKPALAFWLKDEEAWILDQMYRLSKGLSRDGYRMAKLFEGGLSRLLVSENWHKQRHADFLHSLEAEKRKLVARESSS